MNYSCNYSLVTSDCNNNSGNIAVWDGHTGVNLMTLIGNKYAANSIAIVKDTVVACVESPALLEIWRLSSEGKKRIIPLPAQARAMTYYKPLNILTCFIGFDVYMWQPETGQLLTILSKIHSHPGTKILFTSKNNVITIDESGLIAFWKINMNEFCDVIWKTRPFGISKIHAVVIEERYQLFVTAENGKLILLSLADGLAVSGLVDLSLAVCCVERSMESVFIGCNNSTLVVFSIEHSEVTKKYKILETPEHSVTQLALTPDGKSVIVGIDGRSSRKVIVKDGCLKISRPFTIGTNVSSLCTVNKTRDMFVTENNLAKILVKRLNFTLDKTSTNKLIDLEMPDREKSASELLDGLDSSCYDIYRQLTRDDHIDKQHKEKIRNVQNHLFAVLNK